MNTLGRLSEELPTALFRWYPFKNDSTLLYLGKEDAVFDAFSDLGLKAELCRNISEADVHSIGKDNSKDSDSVFRYIVVDAEVFEKSTDPQVLFQWCVKHLDDSGIVLLVAHNRFGIRYFCGDKDLYTGKVLDGPDDYRGTYDGPTEEINGRMYDSDRIVKMLTEAGLSLTNRYSVMPGLENPVMMYADGYIPAEKLISRMFPQYYCPDTVFLEEEKMYDDLLANGMFHQHANAYLYECMKESDNCPACDDKFTDLSESIRTESIRISDALQITSSLDRGRENSIITVIHRDHTVTKQAAYPEGIRRVHALAKNMEQLRSRGIRTVEGHLDGDVYVMPYIEAETGEVYLKRLLKSDRYLFLRKMDEFRDLIYKSSDSYEGVFIPPIPEDENEEERRRREEHVPEEWEKTPVRLLKDALIDMVPLNTFYIDGEFVFFDQEICEHGFPADYIMHRTILIVHGYVRPDEQLVSMREMFDRYNMPNGETGAPALRRRWFDLDDQVIRNLRKQRVLADYYGRVRKNPVTVNANRQRMNYSDEDRKRFLADVFYELGDRKIVIFGSGKYAKIFYSRFGANYPIIAAVDNDGEKWNTVLFAEGYKEEDGSANGDPDERKDAVGNKDHGIRVASPAYLKELAPDSFRVIICIKNFIPVADQLNSMGIHEYTVYDPYREYDRMLRPFVPPMSDLPKGMPGQEQIHKPYHLGYTAGAFDMFHTGHVNLLRRSKEMCDYLIVGVMSDEAIRNFKGKEPVIPYEDRAAVVASCRYVDEVVEIPYMRGNSDEAWMMYHFDVQFCGSDYIGNEGRMKEKEFLETHGAALVMFPYTEHTSSSKIREKMNGEK